MYQKLVMYKKSCDKSNQILNYSNEDIAKFVLQRICAENWILEAYVIFAIKLHMYFNLY